MRARDLVPIALLGVLVTFVAVMASTAPSPARADPPMTLGAGADSDSTSRAAARQTLADEAAGTYVTDMLAEDSLVVRWPDAPPEEPIRVFIQPAVEISGWRQRRLSDAQQAFRTWERVVPLRFVFVGSAAEADVTVRWADRFPEPRQVGVTRVVSDDLGRIHRAEITLAVRKGEEGVAIADPVAAITALHEAGHALGLQHSPVEGDLMAARYTGVAEGLSAADQATARLWYRLPAGSLRTR
jgi:hypothetical protein